MLDPRQLLGLTDLDSIVSLFLQVNSTQMTFVSMVEDLPRPLTLLVVDIDLTMVTSDGNCSTALQKAWLLKWILLENGAKGILMMKGETGLRVLQFSVHIETSFQVVDGDFDTAKIVIDPYCGTPTKAD